MPELQSEENMVTFYKTSAAAFVAAVGLTIQLRAGPLPYTSEAHCSLAFLDETTSTNCEPGWAETPIWFHGENGSNTIDASAASAAVAWIWPGKNGYEDASGVTSTTVTNNLSFTGITAGPIRGGTVDILIDTERVGMAEGPAPWDYFVSFSGFPEFVCEPFSIGPCRASAVPFTLGVPFSFEIATSALMQCPGGGAWSCGVIGEFEYVNLSFSDAAGNPVPIYADSAVPEPDHLVWAGLAIIAGAWALRHRRNV
jgi:hypothetical protein